MKYLLSNYSSYTEANSNENLDIRQSYVCPVVSTYTSSNTYSYDGKYIHIENNGFFGADIIPDAYTKCRYIYNTASLSGNTTFMWRNSAASTISYLTWIVKCAWQENHIGETNYEYINNVQNARPFGIHSSGKYNSEGGLTFYENGVPYNVISQVHTYASTNPYKPDELKYINEKYPEGHTFAGKFYIQLNVNSNVYQTYGRNYGTAGTSTAFFGKDNYLFGISASRVYAYFHHVQIYEDHVLIHNLVPCKRNSDGQYGLYDTIDNTWHGHANLSGVDINASISQIDSTTIQFDPTAVNVEPAEPIFIGG